MTSQSSVFPSISSKFNSRESVAKENEAAWQVLLASHSEALRTASSEGTTTSLAKHHARGQLSARERVSLILDVDSPFLELCAFAGHRLQDSTPSASLVAGIGTVCGRICMILAHIPSLNGGAWNEFTVLKQNRILEIATENKLPLISLVQSAGVFLPQQFRVFHKGGQLFRDLARRTQAGLASCAVVFGSSTAGGAYHPALSDYTIFVQGQAQVFLGGPPLVKMATGEIAEAEELGGAEMHSVVTGLADQLAVDEFDAISKAREWVAALPPDTNSIDVQPTVPPRYNVDEFLSIIPPDTRMPLDMMEVIARIVDDSRFAAFKPLFGKAMITGWAHIHGFRCGIIANAQSVIFPNEADKATQFIRLCNQGAVPIVFLHNVAGFMVGLKTERAGLIKKGAQFVSAVSTSSVPHISIICGASYGAGNYAMCGRAYKPRFLFSWITGRCSVMGPDQLSGVMEEIMRNSARKDGRVMEEGKVEIEVKAFRDAVKRDSESYMTSAHVLDDGVIEPVETRDVLGMCLNVVNAEKVKGSQSHRGLARM